MNLLILCVSALPAMLDSAFAVHEDQGRRWRYSLPTTRVVFSIVLLLLGIVLLPVGLALPDLACTVVGGITLLPGAFASYSYYRIYRGTFSGSYAAFLDVEELPLEA